MTPAPNATRAAGERVSVDLAALEALRSTLQESHDPIARIAGLRVTASAQRIPPAVVDAGTLSEWHTLRSKGYAALIAPATGREMMAKLLGAHVEALGFAIDALATAAQPARAVPRITKDQAGAALSAVVAANREHIAAIISGADAVAIDKAEWAIQCACDDYFIALGFLEGDAPADASEAVRDGE